MFDVMLLVNSLGRRKMSNKKYREDFFLLYSETRQGFCVMTLEIMAGRTRWLRPSSSHGMAPAPSVGCRAAITVLLKIALKFPIKGMCLIHILYHTVYHYYGF